MSKSGSSDLFQNLIPLIITNYEVDNEDQLKIFQEGVSQFTAYIFLQDKLIDNEVDWKLERSSQPNIFIKSNTVYRSAIQNLLRIFPEDHSFWHELITEEQHYYDYIIKEKIQNIDKNEITLADFEEMALAKHSLTFVPIKGIEMLFRSKYSHEKITSLFIPLFHAMQMLDDVDDFTKDKNAGNWTYVQSQVAQICIEENLIDDGSMDMFEERVFYASGIYQQSLEYVKVKFEKVALISKELSLYEITHWTEAMTREVELRLSAIKELI